MLSSVCRRIDEACRPAFFPKPRYQSGGREEDGAEIDIKDRIEIGWSDLLCGLVLVRGASVMDNDVQCSKRFDCVLSKSLPIALLSDIDTKSTAAQLFSCTLC